MLRWGGGSNDFNIRNVENNWVMGFCVTVSAKCLDLEYRFVTLLASEAECGGKKMDS